jgi:hypothetical protein
MAAKLDVCSARMDKRVRYRKKDRNREEQMRPFVLFQVKGTSTGHHSRHGILDNPFYVAHLAYTAITLVTSFRSQWTLSYTLKFNMSLYSLWRHRGREPKLHSFLTSALDGYEWSASRSGCLPQGKSSHSILYRKVGVSRRRSGHFGVGSYANTEYEATSPYTNYCNDCTISAYLQPSR